MNTILVAGPPRSGKIALYFQIKDSLDRGYKYFFESNNFNLIELLLDNNQKIISEIVLYRLLLKMLSIGNLSFY